MSDFPPSIIYNGLKNLRYFIPENECNADNLEFRPIDFTLMFSSLIVIFALYLVSAIAKYFHSFALLIFSKYVSRILLVIVSIPFIPIAWLSEKILNYTIEYCGRKVKEPRNVFMKSVMKQLENKQ